MHFYMISIDFYILLPALPYNTTKGLLITFCPESNLTPIITSLFPFLQLSITTNANY